MNYFLLFTFDGVQGECKAWQMYVHKYRHFEIIQRKYCKL